MTLKEQVWESKYKYKNEKSFSDTADRLKLAVNNKHNQLNNNFVTNIKRLILPKGTDTEEALFNSLYFSKDICKDALHNLEIILGGSMMANLGTDSPTSLSNCFVTSSSSDNFSSIIAKVSEEVNLMKRRGGVGRDMSTIRPAGSIVKNAANTSSGVVSMLEISNTAIKTVAMGGRRGAAMYSLDIYHPDIPEFINAKLENGKISAANLSIRFRKEFFTALKKKENWVFRFPIDLDTTSLNCSKIPLETLTQVVDKNGKEGYVKIMSAEKIWDMFISANHASGDPGGLFLDAHYRQSPDTVYPEFRGESTNPCQPAWATVLTTQGIRTFADIQVGSIIWSKEGWTTVVKKTYSGIKDVFEYRSKSRSIFVTKEHKLVTSTGKVEAYKATELEILPYSHSSSIESDTFEPITSFHYVNTEDVFDITVDNASHTYWSNGVNVSNCGEIFMKDDSCRLLCVNLSSLIDNPFTSYASINEEKFKTLCFQLVLIADALVDLEIDSINRIINKLKKENLPEQAPELAMWKRFRKSAIKGRRAGIGITGYADACAKLGVKYGQDSNIFSLLFANYLHKAEKFLAKRRGTFPAYSRKLEKKSQSLYSFKRRHISYSTIAPTGSISILAECTSGIEPLFLPYYKRARKVNKTEPYDYKDAAGDYFKYYLVIHPGLIQFYDVNSHKFKDIPEAIHLNNQYSTIDEVLSFWKAVYVASPYYMQTAEDIHYSERVTAQALWQDSITHSISSTVNLPNSATKETISDIYLLAHKQQCKGITVYRDGCKEGILTAVDNNSSYVVPYIKAIKRPKVLKGKSYIVTAKKTQFAVIVGVDSLGKPTEIFASACPPGFISAEGTITKIKKGVYKWEDIHLNTLNNCAIMSENAEERALTLLVSQLLRTGAHLPSIIKTIEKVDDNIVAFSTAIRRILSNYIVETQEESTVEKCPECGQPLQKEGGCKKCTKCTYSLCLSLIKIKC